MSTEGERHSKFLSYLTGARYVLSAVSVLVVAQPSSEVPEGLMNYPVYYDARSYKLQKYNSEIIPTRATIAFILRNGFTLHVSGDNSTHHQEYNAVYGLSGRQVSLCCNFVNILVVLSLSVVLSCR